MKFKEAMIFFVIGLSVFWTITFIQDLYFFGYNKSIIPLIGLDGLVAGLAALGLAFAAQKFKLIN